jgi:hypothetical protein
MCVLQNNYYLFLRQRKLTMQKQQVSSVLIAVILILLAAISRVVMYPHNFSPMIGMAIFGGAIIKDKRLAFALPLLSMFISDVMFEVFNVAPGFWGLSQFIGYGIFGLITGIAFNLKKITVLNVVGYSLMSSVIFFVLSNLSFFLIDNPVYHTYTQDVNGFFQCFYQALPYSNFIADLVYSGLLFGIYSLVQNYAFKKAVA